MLETFEELKIKITLYEQNGAAKLFYALNRKMNEMADLLNSKNLNNITLDDSKDKTFDRMKVIWNDASSIAEATKILGAVAGVTGKEEEDINRKPFVETIAQPRT